MSVFITPDTRLQCYEWALIELQKPVLRRGYPQYFCYLFSVFFGYSGKVDLTDFPEIYKHKPNDYVGVSWFNQDEAGRRSRIRILLAAIEDVKLLTL